MSEPMPRATEVDLLTADGKTLYLRMAHEPDASWHESAARFRDLIVKQATAAALASRPASAALSEARADAFVVAWHRKKGTFAASCSDAHILAHSYEAKHIARAITAYAEGAAGSVDALREAASKALEAFAVYAQLPTVSKKWQEAYLAHAYPRPEPQGVTLSDGTRVVRETEPAFPGALIGLRRFMPNDYERSCAVDKWESLLADTDTIGDRKKVEALAQPRPAEKGQA